MVLGCVRMGGMIKEVKLDPEATRKMLEEEGYELFGSPDLNGSVAFGQADMADYGEGDATFSSPQGTAGDALISKPGVVQELVVEDDLFGSPEAMVIERPAAQPGLVQEPEEDEEDLYGSPPPSPFARDRPSDTLIRRGLPSVRDYAVGPPTVRVPDVGASVEALLATLQTHGPTALASTQGPSAQIHDDDGDFYGTTEVQQIVEVEETRVAVEQEETTYVHVEECTTTTTTEVTEEVEQPHARSTSTSGLPGIDLTPEPKQSQVKKKTSLNVPEQQKESILPPEESMAPASGSVSKEPAKSATSTTPLKLVAPIISRQATPVQARQSAAPPKKPTLAHVSPVKPKSTPEKKTPSTTQPPTAKPKERAPQTKESTKADRTPNSNPTPKRKATNPPPKEPKAKNPPLPSTEHPTPTPTPANPPPKKTTKPKKIRAKSESPTAPSTAPLSPGPTKKRLTRTRRKDPVLADASLIIGDREKRTTRSRSGTPATYKEDSGEEEVEVEVKKGRGKGKKRAADGEYVEGKEKKRRRKKGE
jgi:hypothetical protein